ncbi:uncharacterized protein DNG_08927 [Cephalotrichum gorgonifer]|uniref:F-box domain-containing protein n=1 Tax=Cephalotrichum gorgonifer TaxID=2041049 RepID=A0AAE8SYZ4_9PEZI|nr:uncharacterized protein DNG_08927 [Cephalotrichum gorgonifer]
MLVTHIPEILELIARFADADTLLSLRLVSHLHHKTSLQAFATAWFAILDTDLSPSSIAKLHRIASNDIFARAVRTVRVRIGRRRSIRRDWPRTKQGALDLSSPSAQMFLRSLCSFTLCNGLELTDVSEVAHSFNFRPVPTVPEVLYLLLSLFTLGGGPPISSVRLIEKAQVVVSKGGVHALRDMTRSPAFKEAWGSRVLHFEYRARRSSLSMNQVLSMIEGATLLRSLSLTLEPPWAGMLLFSLSVSPVVQPITTLALTSLTLSPGVLASVIAHYRKTLTSLTLACVCLYSHNVAWFNFFDLVMEAEFLRLKEIRLVKLRSGRPSEPVYFYPLLSMLEVFKESGGRFELQLEPNTTLYPNLRYRGPPESMRLALGTLRGWTSVQNAS